MTSKVVQVPAGSSYTLPSDFSATNTIEVFVSNLRRKLESDGEPRLLHTIRGAGYVLRA